VVHVLAVGRDITEIDRYRRDIHHQAFYDSLTGLPNRALLFESISRLSREHADRGHPGFALMLLDIDNFTEINDALGQGAGDPVLQETGRRLAATVHAADLAARLGGDEFGILLPGASARTAQELAGRILRALEAPFAIAGQTLEVGASIGIARYPEHGHDPQLLLQRADVAMYTAKHDHAGVAVYREEQDQHSVHRLALTRELRQGLQEQQLILYYQPKIDLATGGVEGVEALVRWRHPTRGLIPPDTFIPLAEQNGLIGQLTAWVLETALAQCRAWQIAGTTLAVAVNLSARTLQDPQLPDLVGRLLVHHALAGSTLTLEITESSLIGDPDRAREVLRRLHALGIQLSIDDFGTGYSSLGYLKDLPVDEVKIDRSFVRSLYGTQESTDVPLVRSIIALAHALHLRVVAEGVEDARTRAILADLCCDAVQGYLISRPLPAGELDLWLQTFRPAPTLATPGRR
jgi:diguanylate cyclase (GGDEF)-like protein